MRDMKSPMLVILTIPVTLIISILVFYLLHISINIISLSGLVLGIGMMVDNSIIVIDNITARWIRGGAAGRCRHAGHQGSHGSHAVVRADDLRGIRPADLPQRHGGALFYDQAMAVAITLFVAYGVSVTLLPVYYRWWYSRQQAFRPTPWLAFFSFDRIIDRYDVILKWFFRRRGLMWGIYVVAVLGLAGLFG